MRTANVLIFVWIFFLPQISFSQGWSPIGSGINQTQSYGVKVAATNDAVYVIEAVGTPVFEVKKWDGSTWTSLPTISTTTYSWLHDVAVFQGDLYVAMGSKVHKFNGVQWITLGLFPQFGGHVDALEVYNGSLYIGGSFNFTSGGVSYDGFIRFDGSNYFSLPKMPSSSFTWSDLHVHQGSLYCSTDSIYRWTGISWENAAQYVNGAATSPLYAQNMVTYNNELYASSWTGKFAKIKNDTIHYYNPLNYKITDMVEYNNELYIVGDSTTTGGGVGGLTMFDGQNFTPVLAPPGLNQGAVFQGELFFFSTYTFTHNGIPFNKTFKTTMGSALINGHAYLDHNSNCQRDINEEALRNVFINTGGVTLTTDSLGFYEFLVPAGTYNLDTTYMPTQVGKNLQVNCSVPSSITLTNGQVVTQDLGFSNPVAIDNQIFIVGHTGWRARQGFTENYSLYFNNVGSQTTAFATLKLEVPSSVNFVSSNPAPSRINGNLLEYDMVNIPPISSSAIALQLEIDPNKVALGDTLTLHVNIAGVSGDSDLSDNNDTLRQKIVASFDPNDKQASAETIFPGTKRIDYHIRFQNTGNDTAYKVTVVDTLDMTLPITKIMMNSASHAYSLRVDSNVLIWEFDNILLPDSATDEAGSQGYIRFSAGLDPTLVVGDTIDNDAEIYFDYQSPVHTNHAKTAIVSSISISEHVPEASLLKVYPNPASEYIYIKSEESRSEDLNLYDQTGGLIETIKLQEEEETRYPIENLPRGIYFLKSEHQTFRIIIR